MDSRTNSTISLVPREELGIDEKEEKVWNESKPRGLFMKIKDEIIAQFHNLLTAFYFLISDTIKRKKNFLIGFFTVFLVVFFLSILQNTIGRSPIIFLKLVEDSVGEYDLFITPLPPTSFALNFTELQEPLSQNDVVQGSCPRWIAPARVSTNAQTFPGGITNTVLNTSVTLLIINSTLEEEIELGRAWNHRPLQENEIHMSRTTLNALGLEANSGQVVTITIDLFGLAQTAGVFGGQSPESFIRDLLLQNTNATGGNQTLDEFLASIEPVLVGLGLVPIPPTGTNATIDVDALIEQITANLQTALVVNQDFLVVDAIGDPDGKFPVALGNVAILESAYAEPLVDQAINNLQALIPNLDVLRALLLVTAPAQQANIENLIVILENATVALNNFEENFAINDFALSVVVLYSNRFPAYVKTIDGLRDEMIEFSNQVSEIIGFDAAVDFTLPIYIALQPIQFIRLFLDQIFIFVLVVLIILGSLLIYSLMISNVGEKTYEYGMLRALGMRHYSLVELLFMQSLSFSIPGIGLGLLFGFLVYIPIAFVLSDIALSPVDVTMTQTAALLAFFVGLLMPIVALIAPVRRALSNTLRDALDVFHQTSSETTVQVIKLEKLGLSPWQISVSIVLIVVGFIVYYLIPYAFTFQDFPLFFTLLSLILLGMLGGLAIMGQTIQSYLEAVFLWIFVWGDDRRSLGVIIKKNLAAHSARNSKTTLMFTLSLSFIIFAGVTFTLQANTIADTIRLGNGADIRVELFILDQDVEAGEDLDGFGLREDELRTFLEGQSTGEDPLVTGFTCKIATVSLESQPFIDSLSISNLAGFPVISNSFVGVEPNYLQVTYNNFLQLSETTSQFSYERLSPSGNPDVVQSLYTNSGQQRLPEETDGIVIPPNVLSDPLSSNRTLAETVNAYVNYIDILAAESLRDTLSMDTNTPLRLEVSWLPFEGASSTDSTFLMKSRAMVRTLPGFFFSSYRQVAEVMTILVSVDDFERISMNLWNQTDQRTPPPVPSPKGTLLVNLKNGASQDERDAITNGIRNFIDGDFTQVIDVVDLIASTRLAVDGLVLFFNIVSVIAIILCFFVLLLSFTANVRENSWQLAVLRAIGLTHYQITRIYIYEALIIISSSAFLGTAIGLFVSITLTLQFNLFTELPFTFDFPFALFFSVIGMSVIVAIIGSWLPVRAFNKQSIANSLKGV